MLGPCTRAGANGLVPVCRGVSAVGRGRLVHILPGALLNWDGRTFLSLWQAWPSVTLETQEMPFEIAGSVFFLLEP